jgi:hypothetical protein
VVARHVDIGERRSWTSPGTERLQESDCGRKRDGEDDYGMVVHHEVQSNVCSCHVRYDSMRETDDSREDDKLSSKTHALLFILDSHTYDELQENMLSSPRAVLANIGRCTSTVHRVDKSS